MNANNLYHSVLCNRLRIAHRYVLCGSQLRSSARTVIGFCIRMVCRNLCCRFLAVVLLLSYIEVEQASQPVRLPLRLRHEVPTLEDDMHNRIHHRLIKRSVHTELPISFEDGSFFAAALKGQSYMRGFYITQYMGTPPQLVNMLVDTGSSNLAISCSNFTVMPRFFDPALSETYVRYYGFSASAAQIRYANGMLAGDLAGDVVWMLSTNDTNVANETAQDLPLSQFPPEDLMTVSVRFACITMYTNKVFDCRWEGVMGLAFASIVKPNPRFTTFFDTMIGQLNLPNVFSLQFCTLTTPAMDNTGALRGNVLFGGSDESLHGPLKLFSRLMTTSFYGVAMTDLEVAGQSLNLPCSAYNAPILILDSGTSDWLVPNTVLLPLIRVLTEAVPYIGDTPVPHSFWVANSTFCIAEQNGMTLNWTTFPTLSVSIAYNTNDNVNQIFKVSVPPQSYIRLISLKNQTFCYAFGIRPAADPYIQNIMGLLVFEGLYLEFDRELAQVGFSQSVHCDHDDPTYAQWGSRISGPFNVNYSTASCFLLNPRPMDPLYGSLIALVIILGILAIAAVVVAFSYSAKTPVFRRASHCGADPSESTPLHMDSAEPEGDT